MVAVHEDWPGGAGNGLGTLYAFQKAVAKVGHSEKMGRTEFTRECWRSKPPMNLLCDRQAAHMGKSCVLQQLKDGASLAMYHTAGKVQRSFMQSAIP